MPLRRDFDSIYGVVKRALRSGERLPRSDVEERYARANGMDQTIAAIDRAAALGQLTYRPTEHGVQYRTGPRAVDSYTPLTIMCTKREAVVTRGTHTYHGAIAAGLHDTSVAETLQGTDVIAVHLLLIESGGQVSIDLRLGTGNTLARFEREVLLGAAVMAVLPRGIWMCIEEMIVRGLGFATVAHLVLAKSGEQVNIVQSGDQVSIVQSGDQVSIVQSGEQVSIVQSGEQTPDQEANKTRALRPSESSSPKKSVPAKRPREESQPKPEKLPRANEGIESPPAKKDSHERKKVDSGRGVPCPGQHVSPPGNDFNIASMDEECNSAMLQSGPGNRAVMILRSFAEILQRADGMDWQQEGWKYQQPPATQQANGYDCGPLTTSNALQAARGQEPEPDTESPLTTVAFDVRQTLCNIMLEDVERRWLEEDLLDRVWMDAKATAEVEGLDFDTEEEDILKERTSIVLRTSGVTFIQCEGDDDKTYQLDTRPGHLVDTATQTEFMSAPEGEIQLDKPRSGAFSLAISVVRASGPQKQKENFEQMERRAREQKVAFGKICGLEHGIDDEAAETWEDVESSISQGRVPWKEYCYTGSSRGGLLDDDSSSPAMKIRSLLERLQKMAETSNDPLHVALLQSGPDGGSTNNEALSFFQDQYPHLRFRLIVFFDARRIWNEAFFNTDPTSGIIWASFEVDKLASLFAGEVEDTAGHVCYMRFLTSCTLVNYRKMDCSLQALHKNLGFHSGIQNHIASGLTGKGRKSFSIANSAVAGSSLNPKTTGVPCSRGCIDERTGDVRVFGSRWSMLRHARDSCDNIPDHEKTRDPCLNGCIDPKTGDVATFKSKASLKVHMKSHCRAGADERPLPM
ncbi:Hypothetical predicted protein [Lecanosticta acicola]|uniref:Uncharacterized protein n=1 Tax=Lecanosticta acicola TaxID=111012 RepID=A0AAI8YWA9_9PEZI|nr:Hypothetical predicted protein [Lecanosticta acicola]